MNKKQMHFLGISQIFDLILTPSSFMAMVKRQHILPPVTDTDAIRSAYVRQSAFITCLKANPHHQWKQLFTDLSPLNLPAQSSIFTLPDLFELKSFCYHYQKLKQAIAKDNLPYPPMPDLQELFNLLDPEKSQLPSFRLSPLFSQELTALDALRQAINLKLKHVRHELLCEARQSLDLPNLKESFCLARSEGDLIQILEQSPYFVLSAESIANLSFHLADSAQSNALKHELSLLNLKIEEEEDWLLQELGSKINTFRTLLNSALDVAIQICRDFLLSQFALDNRCCIPDLESTPDCQIKMKGLRNLPLELSLTQQHRSYQPLDLCFSSNANLITGPNMGGKSTLLKALAQCAELSRRAIPLPASSASLPYFDFVYYNNEAETATLSSFGAEVVALHKALQKPGKGLFLLDEFSRGTNPYEGEALATAVIAFLAESKHSLVAATHYTKPASLKAISHFRIKGIDRLVTRNLSNNLDERLKILAKAMDYSLIKVNEHSDAPLDALRVAEILGLPSSILKLAREHLDE
ncbi:MAG: AAA family ATPase [Candidatus Cloacimonetes bacterium]|nr:AAA family ATPase [Candidatus Cloacimonadota bacterium]MDD2543857.1 AAA family ATPase [Candidatus Cloacimonadota bacterium]MDD2682798.1 AAA family ATPase [Candidatus Cloacimonadota bacterium]MDD3097294.1 AAA family ATPase [Candidatus Cloacimonadota bacterium]MDD4666860.1 AAA family ATPase [Candidatus Cloacimonadota bacterium]